MGGKEHLRVEAWIALASSYKCTTMVVEGSVKRVSVVGFPNASEARVEVLCHTPYGSVKIGGAEAECGTEGDGPWASGRQPAFAIKSMAQTRATAKAISSVFRWVVELAGYSGTPFEEMPTVPMNVSSDTPTQNTRPVRNRDAILLTENKSTC